MAIQKFEYDLSAIVAGTPIFISLGEAFANLVSVEIYQESVSAAGVVIKMVEGNSTEFWRDILENENNPNSTVEVTTTAVDDQIFLATDFVEFQYIGLSVDVAVATTGTIQILFNSRGSF